MGSLKQKRESMESIIEAVTAKDDVVLSLDESKRRMQARQKLLSSKDNLGEEFLNSKIFKKFVKRQSSLSFMLFTSLLKGIFFGAGVILVIYLAKIYLQLDLGIQFATIFSEILNK